MKFDERLLHEGDYHETGGQDALNALYAKDIPFTAVVCANDEMAAGAMAAAHERGLELPRELSIVGFDDAPISRYVYPKLTTIHYPIADMGTMAARWVLKHVYDQKQDVQQVFEPKLVERDSVSRRNGKWGHSYFSRDNQSGLLQVMRKIGMSPFSTSPIGTILIIALSGFLMGFDGSLFTGAVVFVKGQFGLSDLELGWTVSSHTLTATLSIFLAGPLADRIGRRTVLRIAAFMFAVSAIVAAAASNYSMLIVARLLSGLGVGSVLVAAPMYIAEISPPALRGRMVTINQLFLVLGIFLASASNLLIVRLENYQFEWLLKLHLAESTWRWMLGIGVVPAVLYMFALFFVPESPRWHAMHGRFEAARRILVRAHGEVFAERELAEVSASMAHETRKSDAGLRDLWVPQMRSVLIIGLVVGILQQITGINRCSPTPP